MTEVRQTLVEKLEEIIHSTNDAMEREDPDFMQKYELGIHNPDDGYFAGFFRSLGYDSHEEVAEALVYLMKLIDWKDATPPEIVMQAVLVGFFTGHRYAETNKPFVPESPEELNG